MASHGYHRLPDANGVPDPNYGVPITKKLMLLGIPEDKATKLLSEYDGLNKAREILGESQIIPKKAITKYDDPEKLFTYFLLKMHHYNKSDAEEVMKNEEEMKKVREQFTKQCRHGIFGPNRDKIFEEFGRLFGLDPVMTEYMKIHDSGDVMHSLKVYQQKTMYCKRAIRERYGDQANQILKNYTLDEQIKTFIGEKEFTKYFKTIERKKEILKSIGYSNAEIDEMLARGYDIDNIICDDNITRLAHLHSLLSNGIISRSLYDKLMEAKKFENYVRLCTAIENMKEIKIPDVDMAVLLDKSFKVK